MARVNTDILEVSELKWAGMGEDDHYIYYCGQEFLKRNVKNERMILIHFQCKPFNNNSNHATITDAKKMKLTGSVKTYKARILSELHALLQRIFLTQVLKLDLLHCRQILYRRATKEAYKTS